MPRRVLLILFLLLCVLEVKAQRIAVSTNVVDWAILAPNAEIEVSVDQHNTVALGASVAPWNVSSKYSLSKLTISPEYKYWFTSPYFGHFLGAGVEYAAYDLYWNSSKYSGNAFSAGIMYGYSIIISKKWNIVPHIALGGICDIQSGVPIAFYPAVTNLGINFQMVLR